MDLNVSIEALKYAKGRVGAFAEVNLHRAPEEKFEAIELLWESVGMSPLQVEDFYSITGQLVPSRQEEGFLLGVLFGLSVREYDCT